jgi:hypothetical protein
MEAHQGWPEADDAEAPQSAPRSRPNSRLEDRLAKAVKKGTDRAESRASSDLGSRPESPALRSPVIPAAEPDLTSIDSKASEQEGLLAAHERTETNLDITRSSSKEVAPPVLSSPLVSPPAISMVVEQPAYTPTPSMSLPIIVTPQAVSPRQSLDSTPPRQSIETPVPIQSAPFLPRDRDELEAELLILQRTYDETLRDNREELNAHLERIDALQSKLVYLSQQLSATAKEMAADSSNVPEVRKLAEKDVQIAVLMEEGQKLSKSEMKRLVTVKKLRAKVQEQDKEITTLKQRVAEADKAITEQSDRARRAEASEKSAQEKLKVVSKIEKDIELIRAEREEAGLTISELRRQLDEALARADAAEKRAQAGAVETERRVTVSLQEDLENIRIEKKLADERAKRELQAAREEARNQQEKAKVTELELRGEITVTSHFLVARLVTNLPLQNLESKLELLRSRTEEATSSITGDSQAKLLRQIEILQTQYSLASENWQGIETTLTSRIAGLEKDRDETAKRESDVRRKAREVNSKARRLEEELESVNDRARALEHDLSQQHAATHKLQTKLLQAENAAQDARIGLERAKKVWEVEVQQRLEDERSKWKVESQMHSLLGDPNRLRADSPSTSHRKHSPDPLGIYSRRVPRSISGGMDMPLSPVDAMFDEPARRPSGSRQKSTSKVRTPEIGTPQRQDSIPSSMSNVNGASALDTPSIRAMEHDDPFDNISSPHRTINDMISVSTVGAGPSVQLVERMSAAVRRLESEKATSKEEMNRLSAQRDEAREEVVALMREMERKRVQDHQIEELELKLREMNERYQTTLEMLGEKTERVDELESDVDDLKKMYRELVQTMK